MQQKHFQFKATRTETNEYDHHVVPTSRYYREREYRRDDLQRGKRPEPNGYRYDSRDELRKRQRRSHSNYYFNEVTQPKWDPRHGSSNCRSEYRPQQKQNYGSDRYFRQITKSYCREVPRHKPHERLEVSSASKNKQAAAIRGFTSRNFRMIFLMRHYKKPLERYEMS